MAKILYNCFLVGMKLFLRCFDCRSKNKVHSNRTVLKEAQEQYSKGMKLLCENLIDESTTDFIQRKASWTRSECCYDVDGDDVDDVDDDD